MTVHSPQGELLQKLGLSPVHEYAEVLAQVRPADTNINQIYNSPVGTLTILTSMYIVNTSGAAKTFRFCLDEDGTTFDESTALFWDTNIDKNQTIQIPLEIALNHNGSGNIAFRSSGNLALTITVFGFVVPMP